MLSSDVIGAVVESVAVVEDILQDRILRELDSEEPAMSSTVANQLGEIVKKQTEGGAEVIVRVLDSAGRGSSEREFGADICAVVDLEIAPDVRVRKGFLVQAKRSGSDGLNYNEYDDYFPNDDEEIGDIPGRSYSHWLYRGTTHLDKSGTVTLGKPSPLLKRQCADMLKVTASSFVWLYGEHPIAVVSASAISAASSRPPRATPIELGTKRLDDFFIHVLDCFIGDPSVAAWDNEPFSS